MKRSGLSRRAVLAAVLLGFAVAAHAQNPSVTIEIDAFAGRRPINPAIYGVAYGSQAVLADLNVPINRLGGNNTSRYNWRLNADNRGSDWYFESIGDASAAAGERGDSFLAASKGAGAQAMLTIPTVGWVARLGPARSKLSSFSVAKYGAQTGTDWQWFPDAGNGVRAATGQPVAGNDPNDASTPADSAYQQGWVQHLVGAWGAASAGGLAYYILDNEPSIWHATHRDVHPTGATMAEIRDKILDYAAKIKALDPSALVVGPEEWGWSGYFYSGYDQQWGAAHGWSSLPDRASHGGSDYLPWLLDQLRQNQAATGRRLLDVFSVHYYPQSGEFSSDVSPAMQWKRNRSTRSLWDPSYVDESWIQSVVQLIPRLRGWVSSALPGTAIAITEYNWGAEAHINGATAQADILGIFGREGLDLAARWAAPDPSTPTYKAMKLYRNYDGRGAGFGNGSVSATGFDSDNLSAFAAVRSSDGALTVVVIGKTLSGATPIRIHLSNFAARGPAQAWQLTSANAIVRLADLPVSGDVLQASIPAQSVTLFVVAPLTPSATGDFDGDGRPDVLWRNGSTGQNAAWLWNGGAVFAALALPLVGDTGWKIAGVADFDGDGHTDILWRHAVTGANAVWIMNGGAVASVVSLPAVADTTWRISGFADFNGDGKPDILWQQASGLIGVWLMNGSAVGSVVSLPAVDPGWKIAGTGDFNGDGKPDIVLRHDSGSNGVWYFNGTAFASSAVLPFADPSWALGAIADYDGDGRPDLVWRHASGTNAIWLLSGTAVSSAMALPLVTDPAWKIAGPR